LLRLRNLVPEVFSARCLAARNHWFVGPLDLATGNWCSFIFSFTYTIKAGTGSFLTTMRNFSYPTVGSFGNVPFAQPLGLDAKGGVKQLVCALELRLHASWGRLLSFSPLSLTPLLLLEASGAALKAVGSGTLALALPLLSSSPVSVPASPSAQVSSSRNLPASALACPFGPRLLVGDCTSSW